MYLLKQVAELHREIADLSLRAAENRTATREVGVVAGVAILIAGLLAWDRFRQALGETRPAVQSWDRPSAGQGLRRKGAPVPTTSLEEVSAELVRLRDSVDRITAEMAKTSPRSH